MWILATTCLMWKETVRDILVMAFAAGPLERGHMSDSEFFCLVRLKLRELREFGIRACEQSSTSLSIPEDRLLLVHSYSLYLTCSALRHHAVQLGQLDAAVHLGVVIGLKAALNACQNVTPSGLARPLIGALENKLFMVDFGTAIAKARKDLEDCLPPSSSGQHQGDTKTEMHKALELVEKKLSPFCNDIDTEVRQLLEVSRMIETLGKCRDLNIDMDEDGLRRRASVLVERWR